LTDGVDVITDNRVSLEGLLYTMVESDALDLCDIIADAVNSLNSDYILFTTLCESLTAECGTVARFASHLTRITSQLKHKKCYFMFHSWWQPYHSDFKDIGADDILFIDSFLVHIYYTCILEKHSVINTTWNSNAKQFLFLTGAQHKIHRTRLLYKFYKNDMLKSAEWSWVLTNNRGLQFLEELSDSAYQQFINDVLRSPDNFNAANGEGWMGKFDVTLFANSLFQVISETYFDTLRIDNPWITEKTWKCILNRLPFIIAGNQLSLKKLKDMGFATFEDFLLIPNYDDPDGDNYLLLKDSSVHYRMQNEQWSEFYNTIADPSWPECKTHDYIVNLPDSIQQEIYQHLIIPIQSDTEMRLDAIVENTKHWLMTLESNKNAIVPLVEHNYNQLIKLAKIDWDRFHIFLDQHNIAISWERLMTD